MINKDMINLRLTTAVLFLLGLLLISCTQEDVPPVSVEPEILTFFSFNNLSENSWNGSVHQAITEKTGVRLDMEFIGDEVPLDRATMMVAGEEYANIINARGLGVPEKLISAGALIPLENLIDEYGDNIKRIWGSSLTKLRNPDNGHIYFLPSPKNRPEQRADANQCLLIQYDVLEKTGWPVPQTLDDVRNILLEYTSLYEDLDGQSWVPWGFWGNSWGYNITINNAALWVNGFTDDAHAYVDPDSYDVSYFNSTSYFKDYLKWMNSLYLDGLLRGDNFILGYNGWLNQVESGRVLAMIDGTWDIRGAEAVLRNNNQPMRCYARFPIVLEKEIQDRSQIMGEAYSWGLGISRSCEDPVQAIKFLDFLCSDEGTILLNWGVEGIHYFLRDGKRYLRDDIRHKLQIDPLFSQKEGFNIYEWNQYHGGILLDDGQFASPLFEDQLFPLHDETTRMVLDQYGIKNWIDNFNIQGQPPKWGHAWTISIDPDSPAAEAQNLCDDIRHVMVPKIVMSPDFNEFEKEWLLFIKELSDSGHVDEYENYMTEQIKKRIKIWGIFP